MKTHHYQDFNFLKTKELSLTGIPLKLFYYFDRFFLDLAKSFNAQEFYFPGYLPIDFLKKIDYLESFPHLAVFTSNIKIKGSSILELTASNLQKELTVTGNLLTSASCYHYFQYAEGKQFDNSTVATTINRCFRNEDSNSVDRLSSFTMREIIFLGPDQFVEEVRLKLMDRTKIFANRLGIKFSIDQAQDPFFMPVSKGKLVLQKLHPYKYELRVKLKKTKPLAIASFNNHADFFVKKLNISLKDQNPSSGCVAFGLERWVWSFLAIYGDQSNKWPEEVRLNL